MLSAAASVAVLCSLFASSLADRSSKEYLAQKFLANKKGWCLTKRTYKTKTDPKVLFRPLTQFYNEGTKWVVEMTYRQPPSTNVTYFAHACLGIKAKKARKKNCRADNMEYSPCVDAVLFRYLIPSRREPSVPGAMLKLLFLGSADSCLVAKIDQDNLPIEKESAADGSDCVLFEVAGKHRDKPSPACEDLFKSKCLSMPKKPMDLIIPLKFFKEKTKPLFTIRNKTTKIKTSKLPKYTPVLQPDEPSENSKATTKNKSTGQKRPKLTPSPRPEETSESSETTTKNKTTRRRRPKPTAAPKPEELSGASRNKTKRQYPPTVIEIWSK